MVGKNVCDGSSQDLLSNSCIFFFGVVLNLAIKYCSFKQKIVVTLCTGMYLQLYNGRHQYSLPEILNISSIYFNRKELGRFFVNFSLGTEE